MTGLSDDILSSDTLHATAQLLAPHVVRTPTIEHTTAVGSQASSPVNFKLEVLQHTGSFKARGALNVLFNTPAPSTAGGVTAVSAGNHAIAVAYAAKRQKLDAKLVMFEGASPLRRRLAEDLGAEIVLARDVAEAFEVAEQLQQSEGRFFVHPFEGPYTTQATATLGLEWIEQLDAPLDAVIVGVGGGGLMSGVAVAFKCFSPTTRVIGVEPEGADTMHRSFEAGSPQRIDRVTTIADSLGAPMALPYSFGICKANVDRLVKVTDAEIVNAMATLFYEHKLAVEPAAAAGLAALRGSLAEELAGKRVGVLLCGSNIETERFCELVNEAEISP